MELLKVIIGLLYCKNLDMVTTEKTEVSKRGRPSNDESSLSVYVEQARHEGMRALIRAVIGRGIRSLNALAKMVERDPRALADTLRAKRPRYDSVKDIVMKGLGFPAIVARALVRKLRPGEAGILRDYICGAIEGFGRESLGTSFAPARAYEVRAWLERQPANVTVDVGRECLLALYSLDVPGGQSDKDLAAVLGPVVAAIVGALRTNGFNAFMFTQWRQGDSVRASLSLEAQAWTNLLCEALGFQERIYFGRGASSNRREHGSPKVTTEPTEPKDSNALHAVVGRYLKRGGAAYLTRCGIHSEYDALDLDALQRFNRAQMAAKRAFREAFYSSENEETQ